MSYHFSLQARDVAADFEPERIEVASGLAIRVHRLPDQANTRVWRISKGAVEFGLFSSDGEYWSERLDEKQLKLFVQMANVLNADVVGEEG
ncbi:MAG TPA: hypothetical protein VHK27_07170, partial [Gammaproteobacteria bacterium]|nr:hypothetical protein [Gammaproteobacteria bacterium]